VAPAPDGEWAVRITREENRVRLQLADGRFLEVPTRPTRVVSTLPSITEIVAYLAGTQVLVGVSLWCDWPAEVRSLPKVSVIPMNVEGLKALAPDLLLCDATLHAGSLHALRGRFPMLLAVENRSLPHLVTTLTVLGEVFGTDASRARAAELIARLAKAEADARVGARTPPLRVLLVGQPDPLHVLGPGSLLDDLLRACGCVDVACDLGRASAPFSVETVIARRPDWILTTGDPLPEDFKRRWTSVPAVREGRIASANADDLLRPGPRTPDALARLAAVLRGDLPPDRLAPPR
jgi:iron complex transport system substrate-binding protein